MQSSLLRFVRRIEQEKESGRKRPHAESEGTGTPESGGPESSGGVPKKRKGDTGGGALKSSTLSKLKGFTHTPNSSPSRGTDSALLRSGWSPRSRDNFLGPSDGCSGNNNGNEQLDFAGSIDGDNLSIEDGVSDSPRTGVDSPFRCDSPMSEQLSTGCPWNQAKLPRSRKGNGKVGPGVESDESSVARVKRPRKGKGKGKTDSATASPQPSTSAQASKVKYTPLEQQYMSIKAAYPDAVLFMECGYRYRFFGQDAELASDVLKIAAYQDHSFMTASIPTHRLNVHLRRLVAAGYKVGLVKQTETAAIKATGSNKSSLFMRELVGLYTRSTLIGADVEEPTEEGGAVLMCVCELPTKGKDKEVTIGFLAVQPSTGNMVYDEFEDNVDTLSKLDTRLSHMQPVEVLYPTSCPSKRLQCMLEDWKQHSGSESSVLRVEALPEDWFEYNNSFATITDFYGKTDTPDSNAHGRDGPNDSQRAEALQVAINLPPSCLSCLGALVRYLKPFNLQRVLSLTKNLQRFSTGLHCMHLNSKTLNSLEILKNQSDGTVKGSLFWVLNHTHTPFGKRLLTKWILYPLKDVSKIRLRQGAVTELTKAESPSLLLLKATLHKLPDLERKLCSAYHKKCSPVEFYYLVRTLNKVCEQMGSFSEMALKDLKSELLLSVVKEVPVLLSGLQDTLDSLCEEAAREADFENLFTSLEPFPDVLKEREAISHVKQQLLEHRRLFRATLSDHSLDYTSVYGDQYLVEVKNKDKRKIPDDWNRVCSTKLVTRYRPPYVMESLKELTRHQEQLLIHAKAAWDSFLDDFSVCYGGYKKAVELLATADCLLSLAEVAKMPGYVCPEMVEEGVIEIEEGRHPVIDLLMEGSQFVANDTKLSNAELRCMIVTGPNMGGKSSYIKQVALMCILGQMGSYVPAVRARLGVLDGVYTRMGAHDNILCGKSTFMMELMDASEIMKCASNRSLVILDELGRGTSTHDGTAIAHATLQYLIEEIRCLTLFVTHYPLITELEQEFPTSVANFHMAYVSVEDAEVEFDRVVFLYHLEEGQAAASYGLNVASLAGLPKTILHTAHCKAKRLEKEVVQKSSPSSGTFNTASEMCNTASGTCNTASEMCNIASEQCNTASEMCNAAASEMCNTASEMCNTASGTWNTASEMHDAASEMFEQHSSASEQCNTASKPRNSSSEQHNTASELCSLLTLLKQPDAPLLSHVLRNFCYSITDS